MASTLVLIPILHDTDMVRRLLAPLDDRCALGRTLASIEADVPEAVTAVTSDSGEIREYVEGKHPQVRFHGRKQTDYVAALHAAVEEIGEGCGTVLVAEATHPFRPKGLFRRLIENLEKRDELDSIVCVRKVSGTVWQQRSDGAITPLLAEGESQFETSNVYVELVGLGLAARARTILSNRRIGDTTGFEVIDDPRFVADVRDDAGLAHARFLAEASQLTGARL